MNFSEQLKSYQDLINQHLVVNPPAVPQRSDRLYEAMNYSLKAGGKRLRPVLTLAAFDLFPGHMDPLTAALAVEVIHTYSLIHDDLPAMDDSDLRRGRPACHKAFDEATAILAGDALIPYAFELLANSYADEPAIGLELCRILAQTAGAEKLVGGQMEDLLAEGGDPNKETLSYVHANKTAAMIRACLQMGFHLGEKGQDEELMRLVKYAGNSLGLAFQAVDDLLDVTRTSEELGKDAAHDAESGKVTWVNLLGEDGARQLAAQHTEDAIDKLHQVGGNNSFLLELLRRMLERSS